MTSLIILPDAGMFNALSGPFACTKVSSGSEEKGVPLEKNCVLPTISTDTLVQLLSRSLTSSSFDTVKVLDTRFPYEYDGGHITGAMNLYQPQDMEDFYHANSGNHERTCLVFHCEFSSSRAPKLFQFMRNLDRKMHADSYPKLSFPNMFILEGGYKAFFESKKVLCEPKAYVKMVDAAFLPQLKRLTSSLRKGWSNRSRSALQDMSNSSDPSQEKDRQERSKRIKRCNFLS
ncbi:M-phase inducer phosphatase [Klebsormidium nitens]|uniref:protein-tyrosine-phosphatase n=1 Tax=Klebsormidium nitens TaxID=105231 RepID=A0A0U9HJZ6_KLENI|nr:M-phase inducer phosphatase [Klebsormidium nitens]|eukprot:GAQ83828.1 M-phase inducer phosphatase [Klebsormidium nitens]